MEEEKVRAIRGGLTEEENRACCDQTVDRFLRADKGNVVTATARLKETIKWRKEVQPDKLICKACLTNPFSHYFHPIGFDRESRPVLYSCLQLADDRSLATNKEHMIMTFEQSIKIMKPGTEKWVWFSDCAGFAMRDLNPGLGKMFLDLASKHYPERLGIMVLCGTPSIFQMLYNIMAPLMDPVTKAKLRMLPYDVESPSSKLKQFMDETFPEDTTEFLLQEMAENRLKGAQKAKRYCQVEVFSAVKNGSMPKKHWGSSNMLDHIAQDPSVLLPQAAATLNG